MHVKAGGQGLQRAGREDGQELAGGAQPLGGGLSYRKWEATGPTAEQGGRQDKADQAACYLTSLGFSFPVCRRSLSQRPNIKWFFWYLPIYLSIYLEINLEVIPFYLLI